MNHRVFFAIIAVLAFTVFFISTAFSPTLSLHGWAYAQINPSVAFGPANSVSRANSAPEFPASETGHPHCRREHAVVPEHRRPGDGHRRRQRQADLLPGKRGHIPLRHSQVHRPVAGWRPIGLRDQVQLHGDGKGLRPVRRHRQNHGDHQRQQRG